MKTHHPTMIGKRGSLSNRSHSTDVQSHCTDVVQEVCVLIEGKYDPQRLVDQTTTKIKAQRLTFCFKLYYDGRPWKISSCDGTSFKYIDQRNTGESTIKSCIF